MPRLPGGPAENLPSCPRPGHEERRVVKDGIYGNPPRQRYRCVGEVVNPSTGEKRPFHRFTPQLPRLISHEPCNACDGEQSQHVGPAVTRSYAFPIREIAAAFVAVGSGASYARASNRARVAVDRPPLAGEHGGALVAEWLDLFAPVILRAYAETVWPETLILARITFAAKSRPGKPAPVAFDVLGAYGCAAGARRGRLWALQASHDAGASEWVDFLRSLDVSGAPRIVLADGEESIGEAVHQVWPASKDQDITLPMCTKKPILRGRSKSARAAGGSRRITAISTSAGPQFAIPTHHSTTALRNALAHVSDFLEPRSFGLRNKRRTNLMLGLVRLHLNGVDIDHRYNTLLREYVESVDDLPPQRLGKDAGTGPRTDPDARVVPSLRA